MIDELTSQPETNEPHPGGRPTGYEPEMCQVVEGLCERGATDEEIADHFGVSVRTIYRWKAAYPEFCQAIQAGKDVADERVERSLYQMAVGTYVKEQQAFKVKTVQYDEGKRSLETEEIKVVEIEKYQAPDTVAATFWLKNRRSGKWKDRQEHAHEHSLTVSEEFERLVRDLTKQRDAPKLVEVVDVEQSDSSASQETRG